ncbi:hypothetical protein D3C80_1029730 [compost metagenome]
MRLERLECQLLGDLRADIALAGKHQANGLDHFIEPCTLGQVTGGAGLQQAGGERVFFTNGHRHHFHVRVAAQQFARRLQAADAGHFHIHQDHVGLELARDLQRCLAGVGLAHHLQAIDIGQHARDARTHQIVVIDHQHPNQADTSHCGGNWIPPP